MTLEMLVIKIPETEDGSRIDRCIRRILGNINQAMLEKYLRLGLILLESKKIKSSVKVYTGQLVQYSSHIKFENGKIKQFNQADINNYYKNLYKRIFINETKDFIAINKPCGLAVQGGSSQKYHVDDMLKCIFYDETAPKLVHRIDKDTSGLLLVAKNQKSAKKISNFFKEHKIIKTYLAIVSPCPKTNSGVIDAPILKKGVDGKQKMKVDYDNGKQSITHYKVLDKIGSRVAVIALYPKTGRTHQLRVHLEHINAPIVGDRKYTGLPGIYNLSEKLNDHDSITQIKWNSEDINNLQLHAYSIHMPDNEIFEAELNEDFKNNLKFLGLSLPNNINNIFT